MKKVLLSLAVIAASGSYVVFENTSPQTSGGTSLDVAMANAQPGSPAAASPKPTPPVATQQAPAQSPGPVAAPTAAAGQTQQQGNVTQSFATATPPAQPPMPRQRPANAPSTSGSTRVAQAGFRDGTFQGPSENAYYGQVQLAAVIKSGHIQKIEVLDYPSDRGRSQYISSVAIPMLEQEAIQAQSSNINIISGATLTSEAFIRSLGGALSPARG